MGKFDGVLVVSDYDDTLYGHDLTVSAENHAAIARFRREGGRFTIATGRALPTFTPQIQRERLMIDTPVVLSNGAAVYDFVAGEYLRRTFLREEAKADMQSVADAFPSLGLEFYHEEDIYILRHNEYTARHMARVGTSWTPVDRAADVPEPYVKLILEASHEDLEVAQSFILARWGDVYEAIFSNSCLLEITRKGSTKGGMVTWLRDYLGIAPEHVYCVGDSSNDLSMLQAARVGYAPANCNRAIRAWGEAHILPDCDHHTIAALIADLDGRY